MRMQSKDAIGSLYSARGLRFGGFQMAQFFEVTEDIEELRSGVREEIVAEAHYLAFWLHRFPEVAFFFGTLYFRSIYIGSLCFVGAFLFEILRFYTLGASPLVSHLCRFWSWIRVPLFVGAAILLWPEGKIIPIAFAIFLVFQGWLALLSAVVMLPIRLFISTWIYRKFGDKQPHLHNMEGLAMQYVIDRWRMKLLPPEEALKFYKRDSEYIEFHKLHGKESFIRAYRSRPGLSGIVAALWLSVIVHFLRALYSLTYGQLGDAGFSLIWASGSFVLWYVLHLWALRHPKD